MSISFLDVCPKRPFQWLIHLTDSDNLKQFLNMEQQKKQFSNSNSDLTLKNNIKSKLQKNFKTEIIIFVKNLFFFTNNS